MNEFVKTDVGDDIHNDKSVDASLVVNADPFPMIPISRQAQDICAWGTKSSGKSFVLAINAFLAYLEGKTIFSNMALSFPYHPIEGMKDFDDLKDMPGKKFLLLDDAERLISSKFLSNQDKADILSLTLDCAKYSTDIYFSVKRLLECDKTLRSGIQYSFECHMELKYPVYTVEEFEEKVKYLNNCCIRVDVYDPEGWRVKTEYYNDLDIYCSLFDTKQTVKKLLRG